MERTVTTERAGGESPFPNGPPGCLYCGRVELDPVFDGELTNHFCPLCGRCWHFEPGFAVLVHPEMCPGCGLEPVCWKRFA